MDNDKWGKSFISYTFDGLVYYLRDSYLTHNNVKLLKMNTNFEQHRVLFERLLEECEAFVVNPNKQNKKIYNKVHHLQKLTEIIIKDGDQNGVYLQHKILYLTFKYLSYLLTNNSLKKAEMILGWLGDVDSLFFQKQSEDIEDMKLDDQLTKILIEQDQEALMLKLKAAYQQENNLNIKEKISFLLALTYSKLTARRTVQNESNFGGNASIKISNLQQFQKVFSKLFGLQTKSKMKNDKEYIYRIIGQVLLGNIERIKSISNFSWPFYLRNYISSQKNIKQKDYRQIAQQYVLTANKNYFDEHPEQKYLINLLNHSSFHQNYQQSFGIVSPFSSCLLGYYFCSFKFMGIVVNLFDCQYEENIIRNLISNSSSTSFQALLSVISITRKSHPALSQIGELYLLNHISLQMFENEDQCRVFLFQMNQLAGYGLEHLVQKYIHIVYNKYLECNQLNLYIFQLYLFLTNLFPSRIVEFQELHIFVFNCFKTDHFNYQFYHQLDRFLSNRTENWLSNQTQNQKVKSLIARFQRIHEVYDLTDVNSQISLLNILLCDLPPCLQVLKVIKYVLDKMMFEKMIDESLKSEFQRALFRFIDPYDWQEQGEQNLVAIIKTTIY